MLTKKTRVILAVVVFLIIALWAYAQYTPGEGERAGIADVTEQAVRNVNSQRIIANKENSLLEFEGFAVGKSHVGTFNEWSGVLLVENGKIVGAEGTIQASSVNTGIGRLDDHLRSDDFFDSEKYPEIIFTSTNIDKEMMEMTGQLVFRGVTKEVTFPVIVTDSGLSTEFFLDVTPFNFKYVGVNKEVRIAFDFV